MRYAIGAYASDATLPEQQAGWRGRLVTHLPRPGEVLSARVGRWPGALRLGIGSIG